MLIRSIAYLILITSFLVWPYNFYRENISRDRITSTIFEFDHQANQAMIRNSNLYPNVFLARFFNNKVLVVTKKYLDNLFVFLDPNYYFFASHPREVINGQNYLRIPFFLLPLFLYGIYLNLKSKKYTAIFVAATTMLLLSFMTRPEQYDLFVWPFVANIIYSGFKKLI